MRGLSGGSAPSARGLLIDLLLLMGYGLHGMEVVVGPEVCGPVWTALLLKGISGAIAGKSHRKQTATTPTTRISDRNALTRQGPGSSRHRNAYISAQRPRRNSHERGRKTAGPGDGLHELGEHDIALARAELGMAGGHRHPGLARLGTRVLRYRGNGVHVVRSDNHMPVHGIPDIARLGLDHDDVPPLEQGDAVERLPIGRAVPGDGEVADQPRHRRVEVVSDALRQRVVVGALQHGPRVVGAETRDPHDREGLAERDVPEGGHRLRRTDMTVWGNTRRAEPALKGVDGAGLLAVCGYVGPPELPRDKEQQQQTDS